MRRLILPLVLLLVACGEKSEAPPDEPAPGSGIQGSLTVHSDYWEFITSPGDIDTISVLLGDGKQFRQPLGKDGIARFEDPALRGPQDVTLVLSGKSETVQAFTYLALDKPEVWLLSGFSYRSEPLPTRQATLTGRVTGMAGTGSVEVRAMGKDLWGSDFTSPDGTFSIEVSGYAPGQVHLVAQEYAGTSLKIQQVGLRRDVAVGGGQTVSGLDIVLDHPVDQQLPVTVNGWQAYAGDVRLRLSYYLEDVLLFSTETAGRPPLAVPAVSRTAPFDNLRMRISTGVGDIHAVPAGNAGISATVEDGAAATLTLPAPLILSSPTLGERDTPTTAPLEGLVLRWSVDPSAHRVHLKLTPQSDDELNLYWTLVAPASITSFTPFTLPAELGAPVSQLRPGLYWIQKQSEYQGPARSYADFFVENVGTPASTGSWEAKGDGYVMLQP